MKDRIAAFILRNLSYFNPSQIEGDSLANLLSAMEQFVNGEIEKSKQSSIPIRRPYPPIGRPLPSNPIYIYPTPDPFPSQPQTPYDPYRYTVTYGE